MTTPSSSDVQNTDTPLPAAAPAAESPAASPSPVPADKGDTEAPPAGDEAPARAPREFNSPVFAAQALKLQADHDALMADYQKLVEAHNALDGQVVQLTDEKAALQAEVGNANKALADHLAAGVTTVDDTWEQAALGHLVSRANNGDTFAAQFLAQPGTPKLRTGA